MWLVGVSDSVIDFNDFMRYLVAGFKSSLNPTFYKGSNVTTDYTHRVILLLVIVIL